MSQLIFTSVLGKLVFIKTSLRLLEINFKIRILILNEQIQGERKYGKIIRAITPWVSIR